MAGDGRRKIGMEDVEFGTGTFSGIGSTPSRINAGHIPFVAQPGKTVEDLVDGGNDVPLSLPDPTANQHPATKKYVDDALSGQRYAKGVKSGLVVKTNATNPTIQVDIDADSVVLNDSSTGNPVFIATDINLTVDITDVGLINGLDTGTEAADTWYYIWVIYNPTTQTTAGLLSLSPTAPTLPSGYTYQALVSAVRNNTSKDFRPFNHVDDEYLFEDAGASYGNGTLEIIAEVPYALVKGIRGRANNSNNNTRTSVTISNKSGATGFTIDQHDDAGTYFYCLLSEVSSSSVTFYVFSAQTQSVQIHGFNIKK